MDGLATLARLRERQVDAQIVLISGHGNIESAVRAIKMGAFDFVEKPLSLDKTVLVIRQRAASAPARSRESRAARPRRPHSDHDRRELRDAAAPRAGRDGGADQRPRPHLRRERHRQGARRAHRPLAEPRRAAAFVELNCAAIPEELIESELFGHVRGAFTGAVADRRGKFEVADGGTIFLDEIADMSLKTQAKVLRVLQEQTMEAVGGTSADQGRRARARGDQQGSAGRDPRRPFREDLYFRLNVIPIFVPPLRDRQEDIPLLADHFMADFAREYGRAVKSFESGARRCCSSIRGPATCASCGT
jgi:two-component system nitrogen regulation response regulator NtrX